MIIASALEQARVWRRKLKSEAEVSAALATVVHRVELSRDGLRLAMVVPMAQLTGEDQPCPAIVTRFVPLRMKRRGVELRLVIEGQPPHAAKVDLTLLQALAQARRWFEDLTNGRAASLAAIAARAGIDMRHIARILRLAFLAPPLVELIAQGRQPAELSVEMLTKRTRLALDWQMQQRVLGGGLPTD